MVLTISMIVIIVSLLGSAWKAIVVPKKTSSRVISALMNTLTVAVIGLALPWYDSLHYFWWYGLVATCALCAGAVAWQAGAPKTYED
ncbi:hypothetical protein [Corynebacterium singulare]|uniref:Uncharacterized protein n=1 Tax=Corynebacterium singulare TaxID=161899 RepID=A0A0B6F0L3_9CORY|nr:hypothetical protein [Corynebacterium singulare]AJI78739.1 hypothetical protein CSING_06020 [Corynebacterium singulare]